MVMGSRTSEGKSAFALQCGYEWSHRHKVIYMSMEMTRNEAMTRLYSYITEVPNTDIFLGRHTELQKNKFSDALKTQLIFSENYGRTIPEIEEVIKQKLRDDTPDILILDYIQCIKTTGANRRTEMDNYIREMRKLAIEKDMLIILCSQLSRGNIKEGNMPSMEGLKETGFLEEHADKVLIFNYACKRPPQTASPNEFRVIISKNKMGMTGYVDLKFKPEIYKFYEEAEEQGGSYYDTD